jgi:hypothetical protein
LGFASVFASLLSVGLDLRELRFTSDVQKSNQYLSAGTRRVSPDLIDFKQTTGLLLNPKHSGDHPSAVIIIRTAPNYRDTRN